MGVSRLTSHVITLFGSARPEVGSAEYTTAYELGYLLAHAGFTLCNGGFGGTMEASARGAKEADGKTIGVITDAFGKREANAYVDEIIATNSLVDRLTTLIQLGKGYVVLKGGTGTLLEFAAVWEYLNKGLISGKPVITIGDYWNAVISTLGGEVARGESHRNAGLIIQASTPLDCVNILTQQFEGRLQ